MTQSNTVKREAKKIADDILKSLGILDELVSSDSNVEFVDEMAIDAKAFTKLRKTVIDLKSDIAFFEESRSLALEIKEKVANDFNTLTEKEKSGIIKFMKDSYDGQKSLKDEGEITQDRLTKNLDEFISDIDQYVNKLKVKLEELYKSIQKEEEERLDLRKKILKNKLESGNREMVLLEEKRQLFDQEIEKLGILEDELKIAIMENDNENQIAETRRFLQEKIQ